MHFHDAARCMACNIRRVFDTPIPDILLLSSMCESCGWNDLVGWDGERLCIRCVTLWRQDVQREVGLHSPTVFPPTHS